MKLRDYQSNIKKMVDEKAFRYYLLAWPRRSGKEKFALQLCLDLCREKKSVVYYVVPMLRMARASFYNDLKSTEEYIVHKKKTLIEFKNGSSIRFIGGGSDPKKLELGYPDLCIFSEYSMIDPALASKIAGKCNDSGGDSIFIGTPFLKKDDPMRLLYNNKKDHPVWYTEALTIEDTKHLPDNYIEEEITNGLISDEVKQRDFYPTLT